MTHAASSSTLSLLHPTAIVDPGAHLSPSAQIGPACIVGAAVTIADHCHLLAACTVLGPTELAAHCRVFPYAVLGADPQDRSYHGEATRLTIGPHTELREHVTVHRGTGKDRSVTSLGCHNLLMVGVHVAHDCHVGDFVTLGNETLLGGHVHVGDHVVTGGRVAVAPHVRIGRGAFLAAGAMVERDVPPFVIVAGDRARVRAVNRVGLTRMGLEKHHIAALERAFRLLFGGQQPLALARQTLAHPLREDPYVQEWLAFFSERS